MRLNDWCIAFPGREALLKGLDDSFYNNYAIVKSLFDEASEYLKFNLKSTCYFGSFIEHEWQTICLVTHCYAIYQVISKMYGMPKVLSGYSQGEFTACTAAGVFSFPEVLGLIYNLEKLLNDEKTSDECMYRIVDIDIKTLEECCRKVDESGENICISAYISETQNIVSGKKAYIDKVIRLAKDNGARWAINLHSNKAYHSHLCNEAAIKAKQYFNNMMLSPVKISVYSCYDGEENRNESVLCNKLSKQINHPIQWKKIIKNLVGHGVTELLEIGPGCTVSANSRIADTRMNCKWIGCIKDLW